MGLYSLKMRASHNGEHVSGAEKIIEQSDIAGYTESLIDRGLHHSKGEADFINIKIEAVKQNDILYLDALPVSTVDTADCHEGRNRIRDFLNRLGTDRTDEIMALFEETYNMRGAMLLDINSLKRLEPDKSRGIRATYMDMERRAGDILSNTKNHFLEAIVLATKVANAPGIVGEICISDDPDYVTGYVASSDAGYVRITRLKETGSPAGGRIFLYDGSLEDVEKTIDFLEKQRVVVRNVILPDSVRESVRRVNGKGINPARKLDFIDEELRLLEEKKLYRRLKTIHTMQSAHVSCGGQDKLMLASNSYLDMISNQRVRDYAALILQEYGAGSGGSRLLTGNTDIHNMLEEALADFKHTEAALVFNTGYVANLATISALAGKGDVVFSDALNHASIIDGCRLSGAEIVVYAHNDMADLEKKIKEKLPCRGLIVSDAVFSMDGDILKLPEFVALGNRYGLLTMIDEAHSTGVIGRTGRGILEYYDYACDKPDIIMGTLSKAIGSEGGFVCADRNVIEYLINKARGYIFSTSLSPAVMAASYMGLTVLTEHPELVVKLHENRAVFCDRLRAHGIETDTETAIVPVIIGDEAQAVVCQERLMERGYFISAIRYPTVKKGEARLRAALMASHTETELCAAADAIAEVIGEVKKVDKL